MAALYSSPGWLSGLVVNMQASSQDQRPSVRFRAVGCRLGFVVQELRFRTHHSQTVPHAFRLHSTRQTMSDEDYGVFSGCLAICPLIPKTRTLNRVCRPGVGPDSQPLMRSGSPENGSLYLPFCRVLVFVMALGFCHGFEWVYLGLLRNSNESLHVLCPLLGDTSKTPPLYHTPM